MKKRKKSVWEKGRSKLIATPDLKLLLLVYILFSLARFLMAIFTTMSPSVYPDESLYLNLAKSIVTQGTALLNAQRINYIFLLYSLLIAPFYLLTNVLDVFRSIQAFNAMLITLSVFPVFALAKQMTGSRKKAWLAVLFILLLPDMTLSRHLLEENLAYPAQFAAFYLIYKSLKDDAKISTLSFSLLLCALLPFIKPHLLAAGGAFCLILWFRALAARDIKKLIKAFLSSLALGLLVFLIYKALTYLFTQNTGGETVFYVTSLNLPTAEQVISTLKAGSLYLYFFAAACFILPFFLPLSHPNHILKCNRDFMLFVFAAFFVTILGSCYTINLNEMSGDFLSGRVHLRYINAYLPLFILLSLDRGLFERRVNKRLYFLLGAFFLFNLLIGPQSSTSGEGNMIDILPLVMFIDGIWIEQPKLFLQILLGLGTLTAGFVMVKYGWTKKVKTVTFVLLASFFVLGNAAGYTTKLTTSPLLSRDVQEIAKKIGAESAVILAKNEEIMTDETAALDAYLPRSVSIVELDHLLMKLKPDSAYSAFYPKKIKWEAVAADKTPDSAWFITIASSFKYMKLLPETQTMMSKNKQCAAVYLQKDRPWLSSALSGHTNGILENSGSIIIYDSSLLKSGKLRFDLTIQSKKEGSEVLIASDIEQKLVTVGVKPTQITLDLAVPSHQLPVSISISCETGMLRVNDYSLQIGD